jgi:hypothetical protein
LIGGPVRAVDFVHFIELADLQKRLAEVMEGRGTSAWIASAGANGPSKFVADGRSATFENRGMAASLAEVQPRPDLHAFQIGPA